MKTLLPVLFTLTALCAITVLAPANGQGGSVNNAPGVYGGDEYIGTLPLVEKSKPWLTRAHWNRHNAAPPVVSHDIVKRVPWLRRGDCLEIVHEDRTAISLQVISSNDIPDGPIGLIAATVSDSWRNGYYTNTLTTVLEPGETEPQARARLARAIEWLKTFQPGVIP